MSDPKDCILLKWRAAMAAKGVFPLPTEAELRDICRLGRIPDAPSSVVAQWGHAIAFLLAQERFGVPWESVHLTDDLTRPRPVADSAPTPTRTGPVADPAPTPMARLRAWRDQAVTAGRLPKGGITDNHLMLMARGLSSPDDAGTRVPALAAFGRELFDLLKANAPGTATPPVDDVMRTRPRSAMGLPPASSTPPSDPTPPGPTSPPPVDGRPVYPSTTQYPGAAPTPRAPSPKAPSPPTPDPARPARPAAAPAAAGGAPTESLLEGYAETLSLADQPATTVIDQAPDGEAVTYRWPSAPGPVVIYRVVVSDGKRPLVPEMGDLLAASTSPTAVDEEPVGSLFRFVQVWVNTGDSIASAKAGQARLHAECVRVGPITEASGSADYGQVSLLWTAPPGAQRVRVHRLPTGPRRPQGQLAAYEIGTDRTNLTGCVDRGGEAGHTYTYRMVVQARDPSGAVHTSGPVDVDLEWPAVIREITDLVIHRVTSPTKYEPGLVDLEWTPPPVGVTHLYRINEPVGAGILGVEADAGALPQMGFTDQERCKNPIERDETTGRARMFGVVWPPNWSRIHFVPVTILGQRALPGRPASDRNEIPPGTPRLVDRVTQQVITFIWPAGATYVRAYLGPPTAAPKDVCRGQWFAQISEEDYRRHGGLRLELGRRSLAPQGGPEPPRDLAIFLTSVRGETTSEGVSVLLPGRLVVRYAVEIRRRMRVGPVDFARVGVWAPDDLVPGSPPFVMVYRDDRLPMHARDGQIVTVVPDETPDAAPTQILQPRTLMGGATLPRWRVAVPSGASRGYLRLFVSPSIGPEMLRRIVVLDPPVTQLRWG